MGMTVKELERRMTQQELMWHAADYRLISQEQEKARRNAQRKGGL